LYEGGKMPTVVNDVWSTTYYDDNSYITTTTVSQDECIDTGEDEGIVEAFAFGSGQGYGRIYTAEERDNLGSDCNKTPRKAKDLKELLGEPDWEI
jgi:hypothetical protein